MHTEQPLHLVAGRLLGRRNLAPRRLFEDRHDRGLQLDEEGEDALHELLAVTRVVGARRRQPEGAAPLDERAEADEVNRLLEPLAQLGVDARAQRGWLIGVAAERGAEKRAGHQDLTLAMLRF